jgi:hypothetical protein
MSPFSPCSPLDRTSTTRSHSEAATRRREQESRPERLGRSRSAGPQIVVLGLASDSKMIGDRRCYINDYGTRAASASALRVPYISARCILNTACVARHHRGARPTRRSRPESADSTAARTRKYPQVREIMIWYCPKWSSNLSILKSRMAYCTDNQYCDKVLPRDS